MRTALQERKEVIADADAFLKKYTTYDASAHSESTMEGFVDKMISMYAKTPPKEDPLRFATSERGDVAKKLDRSPRVSIDVDDTSEYARLDSGEIDETGTLGAKRVENRNSRPSPPPAQPIPSNRVMKLNRAVQELDAASWSTKNDIARLRARKAPVPNLPQDDTAKMKKKKKILLQSVNRKKSKNSASPSSSTVAAEMRAETANVSEEDVADDHHTRSFDIASPSPAFPLLKKSYGTGRKVGHATRQRNIGDGLLEPKTGSARDPYVADIEPISCPDDPLLRPIFVTSDDERDAEDEDEEPGSHKTSPRRPSKVKQSGKSTPFDSDDLVALRKELRRHAITAGQLWFFMDPHRTGKVCPRRFQRGLAEAGVHRSPRIARSIFDGIVTTKGRMEWRDFKAAGLGKTTVTTSSAKKVRSRKRELRFVAPKRGKSSTEECVKKGRAETRLREEKAGDVDVEMSSLRQELRRNTISDGQLWFFMDPHRMGKILFPGFKHGLSEAGVHRKPGVLRRIFNCIAVDGYVEWKEFKAARLGKPLLMTSKISKTPKRKHGRSRQTAGTPSSSLLREGNKTLDLPRRGLFSSRNLTRRVAPTPTLSAVLPEHKLFADDSAIISRLRLDEEKSEQDTFGALRRALRDAMRLKRLFRVASTCRSLEDVAGSDDRDVKEAKAFVALFEVEEEEKEREERRRRRKEFLEARRYVYAALEGIQEAKLELAKIFKSDLTHREQFQKELADVSPDTAKEDGDTGRFQKAHEIFHKLGARITSSSRDKFTNTKYREQREDVWEESDIVDPYGSKLLDDLATELKAALASHETCVDPVAVFANEVSPGDVIQGSLGDCYLLASLATLAASHMQGKFDISRLIDDRYASIGLYGVKLFVLLVRTVNVVAVFAFASFATFRILTRAIACLFTKEIWVILIEKAFAKINGSYDALDSSETNAFGSVMRKLTGCDILSHCATSSDADAGVLWQHMRGRSTELSTTSKHMMLMSCALNTRYSFEHFFDGEVSSEGLVTSHAYSVLAVLEVPSQKRRNSRPLRLVYLRNPWSTGGSLWSGDYSKDSPAWSAHPTVRKEARKVERQVGTSLSEWRIERRERQRSAPMPSEYADDGTFWMSFEDYYARFDTCVCDLNATTKLSRTVVGSLDVGVTAGGRPIVANSAQSEMVSSISLAPPRSSLRSFLLPYLIKFYEFCEGGYTIKPMRETFRFNPMYKLTVRPGSTFTLTLEQPSRRGLASSWSNPGSAHNVSVISILSLYLVHPRWIEGDEETRKDRTIAPLEILRSDVVSQSAAVTPKYRSFSRRNRVRVVQIANNAEKSEKALAPPSLRTLVSCPPSTIVVDSAASASYKRGDEVDVEEFYVCVCSWRPGIQISFSISASPAFDKEAKASSSSPIVGFERVPTCVVRDCIDKQSMSMPNGPMDIESHRLEANDEKSWGQFEALISSSIRVAFLTSIKSVASLIAYGGGIYLVYMASHKLLFRARKGLARRF
eukprot:g3209.t1